MRPTRSSVRVPENYHKENDTIPAIAQGNETL
jgi:hypothetical protein